MRRTLPVLLVLLLVSCTRTAPLDEKISATTPMALTMWRSSLGTGLTQAQWKAFDLALQEIKNDVMFKNEATGSEAIAEAMRARIEGRPVREILTLGFTLKCARLEYEQAEYEKMISYNSNFRTRAGDTEAALSLAALIKRQHERLKQIKAELAQTRALQEEAFPAAQTSSSASAKP